LETPPTEASPCSPKKTPSDSEALLLDALRQYLATVDSLPPDKSHPDEVRLVLRLKIPVDTDAEGHVVKDHPGAVLSRSLLLTLWKMIEASRK